MNTYPTIATPCLLRSILSVITSKSTFAPSNAVVYTTSPGLHLSTLACASWMASLVHRGVPSGYSSLYLWALRWEVKPASGPPGRREGCKPISETARLWVVSVSGARSMGSLEVVDDALSMDSSMSMGSGVYTVPGVFIVD